MFEIIGLINFILVQAVLGLCLWMALLFRSKVISGWRLIVVGIVLVLFQNLGRPGAAVLLSFLIPDQFAQFDPYFGLFAVFGVAGNILVLIGLVRTVTREP